MAWVRIDVDLPMDGRLAGSGHAWAWPAVVARAKSGDGRIRARELSPRIMAHLWGPSVEEWAEALAHFREEGLLVDDAEHVVVANWSAYQRDNSGAERVRKHRESKRATVTAEMLQPVSSRYETQSNDEKQNVTPDSTVQYRTVRDTTADAVVARPASAAPAGLASVMERWRLALRGRSGAAPLVVGALDVDALSAAVSEKGAEYVTRCIDRAAEVAGGGGPSLSLLRTILRDGVHEPGKGASLTRGRASGAKVSSAYAEGVEASKNRHGARMVRVPGEGYVAEADLTPEQRARIESDGGMVF